MLNTVGLGNGLLRNNVLFMTFSAGGNAGDPAVEAQTMTVNLKKVTNSKILMEYNPTKPVFAECDKQNIPPNNPRNFTASASGMTVSLAWTDNSTDETGFKVLRKDTLTGSFSTVTTTAADATSYSDTVTAAGTYKYRVSTTNSNGDSTGSKVVEVVVE
jgi:trehalose-6-phosphatase